MRKIFVISFLTVFLFTVTPFTHAFTPTKPPSSVGSSAGVAVSPDIYPIDPLPTTTRNFLGQDQYYSVTFRGNGEAVVTLKTIFSNLQESTMSAVMLRIPRVVPQDVIAYQVIREKQCIRYMPQPMSPSTLGAPLEFKQPECMEYREPNFDEYYYGNNKYVKAITTYKGDTITVELPHGIKANSSGSFILYYRATGYAKKDMFGAFNYTFETLKVEDKIRNLQVGISTDSDLILKDATSNVNYQMNDSTAMMKTEAVAPAAGISGQRFDSFYQQIGYGNINKNSSNLQPLDSFTVKGSYAEKTYQFYGKHISIAVIVILLILVAMTFFLRWLWKKFGTNSSDNKKGSLQKHSMLLSVLAVKGLGFVSSLLIVGYTLAVLFVGNLVGSYFSYVFMPVITLIMILISAAMYILFAFVPAIFMGVRKGVWWGVATFVSTVAWLMFYLILIVLFMMVTRMDRYQPYPVMMERGMEGEYAPDMKE
jgi:hypothetical protein